MADVNSKFEDVGEHVPNARKHLAEKTGKRTQDTCTLKEIWPEPDWAERINSGQDKQMVAYLAMAYDGLSIKPRSNARNIPDEQWVQGYIQAINILKKLFAQTETLDQAKQLNNRMLSELGFTKESLKTLPIAETYVFWAAGRGSRTLYSPVKLTTRHQIMARWICEMGWPASKVALKSALFPVELEDGQWGAARIEGDTYSWGEDRYPTSDAAIKSIISRSEKEQTGELIPTRPLGLDLTRSGPDHRTGQEKTPEQVAAEFGFRAIQFGVSVTQAERSEWMNEIYDALADFSDILNMPKRWIGFNGTLALAVGARGVGGISHSAHFECDLQVINLTRASGAGSFAHEWGHAFDHRLLPMIYPNPLSTAKYLSKRVRFNANASDLDERKNKIHKQFCEIMTFCDLPLRDAKKSNYLINAERIREARKSKKYWTLPEEMFARAFESYIQSSLMEQNRTSPWLVHGTLESDYDMACVVGMPYPIGDERIILNQHFRSLLEMIKKK